jgi:DNA-binding PadR family transcriptional regulator
MSAMPIVDHKAVIREILLGFWKVHILHHAAEEPVVGQWILAELRRHGHDVSPGTLYPLLKRMERNGWLRCESDPASGPRGRRYYHLTPRGAAVLGVLREAVIELHHEVVEEAAEHASPHLVGRESTPSTPAPRTPRRSPRVVKPRQS